jgi:hypothetical protein
MAPRPRLFRLFAVAAIATNRGPRQSLEPSFGDWLPAILAGTEASISYARQGSNDLLEQLRVGSAQMNLKSGLYPGASLIAFIAFYLALAGRSSRPLTRGSQLIPPGQQQMLVSFHFLGIHSGLLPHRGQVDTSIPPPLNDLGSLLAVGLLGQVLINGLSGNWGPRTSELAIEFWRIREYKEISSGAKEGDDST